MTSQIVQIAGALLILAGFAAAQAGLADVRSYRYLWPNLVGSAALAFDAWHERQWGFLLLEAVWALVALRGLGADIADAVLERARRYYEGSISVSA